MKILLFFFLSLISYASDGTPTYEIWSDLNITSSEYYYLSAQSGLSMGFLFALSIILILTKR